VETIPLFYKTFNINHMIFIDKAIFNFHLIVYQKDKNNYKYKMNTSNRFCMIINVLDKGNL